MGAWPAKDEIPKTDNGQLGEGHAPRMCVLDRDDVHDMDERFHRDQRENLNRVSPKARGPLGETTHEIVEGEYRPCDVERRMERVCKKMMIQESVSRALM